MPHMNTQPDDPVFPCNDDRRWVDPWPGITTREYMAIHILSGIVGAAISGDDHEALTKELVSASAVVWADALIAALNKDADHE